MAGIAVIDAPFNRSTLFVVIPGHDEQIRRGILRLSRSSFHEPVNIGNPGEFTILECAQLVLKVTGSKSPIVYKPLPQDDPKQRRPNIARAKDLFGWTPQIDLETGLNLSLEYFQQAVQITTVEQAKIG